MLPPIVTPTDIQVYDNLYAKPSQLGLPSNARHSMSVIFESHGVFYFGQYEFTSGMWTTIPGGEKSHTFPDRIVGCWFYPPGTLALIKKYQEDVDAKRCSDSHSRLDPYDPTREVHRKNPFEDTAERRITRCIHQEDGVRCTSDVRPDSNFCKRHERSAPLTKIDHEGSPCPNT